MPATTHPLLAALDLQRIPLTDHQRDQLAIVLAHHDQQHAAATEGLRARIVELETQLQRFEELIDSLMR